MDDENVIHGEPMSPIPGVSLGEHLYNNLLMRENNVAQVNKY